MAACGSARWPPTPRRPTMRAVRARLSGAGPRDPGRSDAAIAQQGDHRRQSVPAHALLSTSPISTSPATSANRVSGCGAIKGIARLHAMLGTSDAMHRDLSRRHGGGDERAGCDGRNQRLRRRRAQRAGARLPSPAGRYAVAGQCAGSGRDHHRRHPAGAGGGQADLPQGARTIVLCLRAGLGRRHRRDGRTAGLPAPTSPLADWRTSRGTIRASAESADRQANRPMALFDKAADLLLEDAQGYGENDFKIPLARRTLHAVLAEATETEHDRASEAGRARYRQPSRRHEAGRARQAAFPGRRAGQGHRNRALCRRISGRQLRRRRAGHRDRSRAAK